MAPTPIPEGHAPQTKPAKPSPIMDPGPKNTSAASPQKTEPKKDEETQKNKDPQKNKDSQKNEDQKNEDSKKSEDPRKIEDPEQNADPVVKPPSSKPT